MLGMAVCYTQMGRNLWTGNNRLSLVNNLNTRPSLVRRQVHPEPPDAPGGTHQEQERQEEDRQDVRLHHSDLHGLLGPLPHLLHTLIPLSLHNKV